MHIGFSSDDNYSIKTISARRVGGFYQETDGSLSRGGITIDDGVIRLYGDTNARYKLTTSILVDKFTKVHFTLNELKAVRGFGICLYSVYVGVFADDPDLYCLTIKKGQIRHLPNMVKPRAKSDLLDDLNGEIVNLALEKQTRQSSLFGPGYSGNAVDGNIGQIFDYDAWEQNSVTHTQPELNPWWEVDLGDTHKIKEVVIFKRSDAYEGDLSNFTLTLYNATRVEIFSKDIGSTLDDRIVIALEHSVGRILRIRLNGDSKRLLCLAEVEVRGSMTTFDIHWGDFFNLPAMNINRIALIQDQGESPNSEEESSQIIDIGITKDTRMEIAVS